MKKYYIAIVLLLIGLVFESLYLFSILKERKNLEKAEEIESTMEIVFNTDFSVYDNGDGTYTIKK